MDTFTDRQTEAAAIDRLFPVPGRPRRPRAWRTT